MTRPVASILVHAAEAWDHTRSCLEALRPRMGVRDELIVVDDTGNGETARGLDRYSWARVVRMDTRMDSEAAWARGLDEATGEVVLFVPGDALFPSRALDDLLSPLADEAVVAAGPLFNGAMAPAQAAPTDLPRDAQAFKAFASEWREQHRSATSDADWLDVPCLAVRRQALTAAGGLIGPVRLSEALRGHGRLAVVREALVFLQGHDDRPLLSACMIVKDEEAALPECLAMLDGVVDEIVVYDTGSTDRTVEIAEEAGAIVVRGYWDDDFGRARNASLEHCSGQWIFHVDADELVEADVEELRAALLDRSSPDVFEIEIDNLSGDGDAVHLTHRARRLFRRDRAHWEGRLHEQVIPLPGQSELTSGLLEAARIKHTGYTADLLASKDKPERNLRIALAALEYGAGERGQLLLNVARSYVLNKQPSEAIPYFAEARELGKCPAPVRRQVLRHGAQALLQIGQPDDALVWVGDLRSAGGGNALADYLEAMALANLGRTREAVEILSKIDEISDDDVEFAAELLPFQRGMLSFRSEAWDQAAADLLTAARAGLAGRPLWAPVVEAHWRAGLDLTQIYDAIDDDQLTVVLGQVLNAPLEAADAFGEALWGRIEGDVRVLAFAVRMAPRLEVSRALEWSVRLREAGHADRCPLAVLANDRRRAAIDRIRASSVLVAGMNDERGNLALKAAAAETAAADFREVLLELDTLAPQLLPEFVAAAARGGERSMELALVLHELGADEEGIAVLLHGLEGESDDTLRNRAADWLEEIGRSNEAALVRQPA